MAATTVNYRKGKLYELLLAELLADPKQPRKSMDPEALRKLATSVAKLGVVQPIVFRRDEQGNKVVVAGERRVEAARQAGRLMIPGVFVAGSYAEIAMVENLLREELTPIEEAEGLQALIDEQHYNQEDLGALVGKAQNTLSEILSLNKLPPEIRDACRGDRAIPKHKLIAIAKKKEAAAMLSAYQSYRAKAQEATPRPQKKDRNDYRAAVALLERATAKIAALDPTAWTEEEKSAFRDNLVRLRSGIDNYLQPPPS